MLLAACALAERSDLLVGRECDPGVPSCDPGQKCLPHKLDSRGPSDFRCRDKKSFEPNEGQEPPLAYCDASGDGGLACPDGIVCNADRVRAGDGGLRRFVCQEPGSPFGPPLPDGG